MSVLLRAFLSDNSPSCFPGFAPLEIDYWGIFKDGGAVATLNSLIIHNDELLIGGSFDYLGPNPGSGYHLDTNSGKLISSSECPYLQLNASSRAAVSDGAGGYYIGGSFTHVRGHYRPTIVHMYGNCKINFHFNPHIDIGANIYSMVIYGDKLYLGGVFSISGATRYLVALNRFTGELDAWNPNVNSAVEKLLIHDNKLYIGGQFTDIDGNAKNRLARFDLTTGALDPWTTTAGINSTVRGLAMGVISGSPRLFVCGGFTNFAIAVDTTTGNQIVWDPGLSAIADTIAVASETVYIGGAFTTVNGSVVRAGFASFDANTANTGADFNLAGAGISVSQILEHSGRIFIFGNFNSILGSSRNYAASIDVTTNTLTDWNPHFTAPFQYPSGFAALPSDGKRILVPGALGSVNPVRRYNLASVSLKTGLPSNWEPFVNGEVFQLYTSQGQMYVGGAFTNVSGQTRTHLASYNLTNFELTSLNPNITGNFVSRFMADQSNLYFTGNFTQVNLTNRGNAASLRLSDGSLGSWVPQPAVGVNGIIDAGDKIFIAGGFAGGAGGGSCPAYICGVLKTSGTAVPGFPSTAPTNGIEGVVSYNEKLYIGGFFDTIGGVTNNHMASLTLATGVFEPNRFSIIGGIVYGLFVNDKGLLVAPGTFTEANGMPAKEIAAINLNNDKVLPWSPNQEGVITELKFYNDYVFLAGSVSSIQYKPVGNYGIAKLPNLE
ncbi:hypothetical protein P3G55_15915 [Leptospira sp. 96542]|nr:hypothetical protein [Leptospira sp. 96542]